MLRIEQCFYEIENQDSYPEGDAAKNVKKEKNNEIDLYICHPTSRYRIIGIPPG